MLSDAAARRVRRLRIRRLPLAIAGTLFFVAGGAYDIWASERLQSTPAARVADAFDRPIARFARLSVRDVEPLDRMRPQTESEQALITELRAQLDVKGRLVEVLLRFLVATVAMVAGLLMLAATFAQWPLLDLITTMERHRESGVLGASRRPSE
jgi:hypothetical protein